jgi:hypothetical protein
MNPPKALRHPLAEALESRQLFSAIPGGISGTLQQIPTVMSPPIGPLAGWEMYLDLNRNGRADRKEPTTLTDSTGNYTFSNIRPGVYRVAPVFPPGWVATPQTLSAKLIRVVSGQTEQPIDFAASMAQEGVTLSLQPLKRPSVAAGTLGAVMLSIQNASDAPRLNGRFDLTLIASTSSSINGGSALVSTTRLIQLAPGRMRKLLWTFRVPATFATGGYSLFATLLPHGASASSAVTSSNSVTLTITPGKA